MCSKFYVCDNNVSGLPVEAIASLGCSILSSMKWKVLILICPKQEMYEDTGISKNAMNYMLYNAHTYLPLVYSSNSLCSTLVRYFFRSE